MKKYNFLTLFLFLTVSIFSQDKIISVKGWEHDGDIGIIMKFIDEQEQLNQSIIPFDGGIPLIFDKEYDFIRIGYNSYRWEFNKYGINYILVWDEKIIIYYDDGSFKLF